MPTSKATTMEQIVASLREWATGKRLISHVYIFGSRVKGTFKPDSDIDIAIKIQFEDADTAFAHWVASSNIWQTELSAIIAFPVDLQWFHSAATPTIVCGLRSSAVIAFARNDQTFS